MASTSETTAAGPMPASEAELLLARESQLKAAEAAWLDVCYRLEVGEFAGHPRQARALRRWGEVQRLRSVELRAEIARTVPTSIGGIAVKVRVLVNSMIAGTDGTEGANVRTLLLGLAGLLDIRQRWSHHRATQ